MATTKTPSRRTPARRRTAAAPRATSPRRPTRATALEPGAFVARSKAEDEDPTGSVSEATSKALTPASRLRLCTPATRRGSELARFLRIHVRRPYGSRGELAIYKLACEVAHLGRVELGISPEETR